jgi:hypothetical protein
MFGEETFPLPPLQKRKGGLPSFFTIISQRCDPWRRYTLDPKSERIVNWRTFTAEEKA